MPIFEYRCEKCGEVVEVLVRPGQSEPPRCPRCRGTDLRKLFSSFGCGSSDSARACGVPGRFT